MLNFLTLKEDSFGLEVSDSFIKIARLKKQKNGLNLCSWGEFKIPEGLLSKGEVRDEEKLAEEIKKAVAGVKGERIKTKNVITCSSELNSFLQAIKMPKMEEQELSSAINFEAENYIPLSINDVYLDFEKLPSENNLGHFNVLLAALSKRIVDPYISCLKKAGFLPYALEIETTALARALIKNGEKQSSFLLIDIGENRTVFAIVSQSAVKFAITSPISFYEIGSILLRKPDININGGKEVKKKQEIKNIKDRPSPDKEQLHKDQKEVNFNLKSLKILSELVDKTKECIDYYGSYVENNITKEGKKRNIEKIILSGKGANFEGLSEFIFYRTKIPVEIGNPWVNILRENSKQIPPLFFEDSLSFSIVLGLALRNFYDKPIAF